MKTLRLFMLLLGMFTIQTIHSQYITPGTGMSYSLSDLVNLSAGVVSFSDGQFHISNTLTIAATDTLRIQDAVVVRVASGIRLEVSGSIQSDPAAGQVIFTAADTSSASTNFKGFRFEDAPGNVFRNTVVSYSGGIQLISSEAVFDQCVFRKNGYSNVSAVITYSNCNPLINSCDFIENARSAIGSGANVQGSPTITDNFIYHNTTDNSNRPQINLGPGASDTIRITGNYIEGYYDNAGGIGISNLVGVGNTKVLLRDNYIIGNRYGYAQIGNNISAVIEHNELIDNNIQNQPNLGGSGLNFQTTGSGNTAIVRHNLIKGNLWGITIQGSAQPAFGTADDPGNNLIYGNENTGTTYALYNNTALPITAVGNYWGTNDAAVAEEHIVHQPDNSSLGLVSYLPLMEIHPVIEGFVFLADENPGLSSNSVGVIDEQNHSIQLVVPSTANIAALIPQITLPRAVVSDPQSGVPVDFSNPVSYTVMTPHGESVVYTVTVTVEPAAYSVSFEVNDPNGTPLTDATLVFAGVEQPLGVYVIENVIPGTYPWEVHHPLYETAFGVAEVTNTALLIPVNLQWLSYDLTFFVTIGSIPSAGATVTVGGNLVQLTDENGLTVFESLLPGSYTWEVSQAPYPLASGVVEITDQDLTVEVELDVNPGFGEYEATQFSISPNPVAGLLNLKSTHASVQQVLIVDAKGQIVKNITFSQSEMSIDVSDLQSGVYTLHIKNEGGKPLRFIKQ